MAELFMVGSLRRSARVYRLIRISTLLIGVCCSYEWGNNSTLAQTATNVTPRRIENSNLPNPIRIHDRVISGGLPEGDEAFRELAERGIKTIISVDGMTPDIDTAAKYGLHYVHLPHGYDGIPASRVKELAKAVKELQGPIYIHCHHGKHRSPAAASVACVSAGLIPSSQAVAILELAGTNPNYKGLYKAAEKAAPISPDQLSDLEVEFKEVQAIPPMAEAMVTMSHTHNHLVAIANASWKSPPNHPDLDPAHEVLLNRELYAELLRTNEVTGKPADFRAWLLDSQQATEELEQQLEKWNASGNRFAPPESLDKLVQRISANCKACHVKYRDVPLTE
ncbi:hypothetical protein [Rhodopirellula sp. MGV]|uniref:hypothetical protein n=1 Tax=Rhodopirellula sp. MGV TaxID=2023130 RepID=UPI00117A163A|nr:hypothetical protein [Rhodopirellula sp. MGV]